MPPDEKPPYEPPVIERYAPFFASSPAKLSGLVRGVKDPHAAPAPPVPSEDPLPED